jgi:selenocysteine lyase/cysteine desulfurase
MNTRYRLVCLSYRGGKFYCFDKETKKRTSLNTTSLNEAEQIVQAKNNSSRQPALNLHIAKAMKPKFGVSRQVIRFSLGPENTDLEISKTLEILEAVVKKLRK